MYLNNENLAYIAKSDKEIYLIPKMANRHGLIAGATGTGKTITLKVLAETFSDMGTPVFLADVKGDLTSMIKAGDKEKIQERLDKFGITDFECKPYPSRFWDVYGKKGHNVRTTISEMGPDLISRLLELTEAQEGVMNVVFKVADDRGLFLIDLKDLKSMVKYVSDNSKELQTTYGNVSPQSAGAIQRNLLKLEQAGGDIFFGEPNLDIFDWIQCNENGKGYINILECSELVLSPLLYSTFLLWMLSELYENLPEVGDLDKPKMIFFFDEAHLLFDDAPKALVDKVEQVVRLIRSKGVGVYFISQKPDDIPEDVLAQLGNRIQHALRAYTPKEQKAIKAAAESFRANPAFDTKTVIQELGVGEALVSFLDENGVPTIVEQAKILPPQSAMSVASDEDVQAAILSSPFHAKYSAAVDRESAYEILSGEAQAAEEAKAQEEAAKAEAKAQAEAAKAQAEAAKAQAQAAKAQAKAEAEAAKAQAKAQKAQAKKQKTVQEELVDKAIKTATSQIGREIGKSISRGILGGMKLF